MIFWIGIRLPITVREVMKMKVWKRNITSQGLQRANGEGFWGRLASASPGSFEVIVGQAVSKTNWIWSRREWRQHGTHAYLSPLLTLTKSVAYRRSACPRPWSCTHDWPRLGRSWRGCRIGSCSTQRRWASRSMIMRVHELWWTWVPAPIFK